MLVVSNDGDGGKGGYFTHNRPLLEHPAERLVHVACY